MEVLMKFLGFALIELNKATGSTDVETARTYDVTVYDKFGRVSKSNKKLNEIEQDWGKLRMTDLRHAVLDGSEARMLSEEEFDELLIEWISRKEKTAWTS